MRLCAVFERANPFACVKYFSASHFDPIPIQEQRMWPDMCDGCMKRVPTSRALRVSKIVFVRSHRACSSMYRFDFCWASYFWFDSRQPSPLPKHVQPSTRVVVSRARFVSLRRYQDVEFKINRSEVR